MSCHKGPFTISIDKRLNFFIVLKVKSNAKNNPYKVNLGKLDKRAIFFLPGEDKTRN